MTAAAPSLAQRLNWLIDCATALGEHSALRSSSDETIAYWKGQTDAARAALQADPEPVPSYDALLIMMQSVCGAFERAGLTDCDDPGEAIDVLREGYESRIAALQADRAGPSRDQGEGS